MLGYSMNYARREFKYLSRLNDFDSNKFSFEQLAEALATVDVMSISADYGDGEDFGEFFRRYLFDRLGLEKIVGDPEYVRFDAGSGMENLSAYTILRLVAQNPLARGLPVSWHFADVEDGGWARRDEFMRSVDQENRFLIVTEGSSDAKVIRHALNLLKPHVADFFDFVDMNEGYPFTGTGNLYNFTKGLIGISVQNNVIILYNNDAEGVSSFNRTVKLNVPGNMRILQLPRLPAKVRNLAAGGCTRRIARQPALAGLQELLGPAVIQALGETLTPAQLGNAALTAQTIQHDADFLLRGILLAGHPADVLDKPLRRRCSGTGLLSHLHSLAVTMSQKSSVIQYPQSVS